MFPLLFINDKLVGASTELSLVQIVISGLSFDNDISFAK